MHNYNVFLFLTVWLQFCTPNEPLPKVSSGRMERWENFKSEFVTPRNIDVWLPENYDGEKSFAVLYMHDGQMLYDSTITWNKQAWDVDEIAGNLMFGGQTTDFIVVGIWNAGKERYADYFPRKPFDRLSEEQKQAITTELSQGDPTLTEFLPNSDDYLNYIVKEIKPMIDQTYKVFTDPAHTRIAGSSMGGLISWYAICEYPDIFGGAACLSTHWPGTFSAENNPIPSTFLEYLEVNLPDPNTHQIYFDCGDQTLDALYPAIQNDVDVLMVKRGYGSDNWQTRYFPGEDHSERAWRKRLEQPLSFLFGLN